MSCLPSSGKPLTMSLRTLREVSELPNEYSPNTHILHFSHRIRRIFIPYPSKAEPGHSGVTAHELKRADSGET